MTVRLRGTSSIISGSDPLNIVDGVIVDDPDDPDGRPVPVDRPAPPGREVLPWQRREVERRPIVAPWLTRADDIRAAARWAARMAR